MYNSLGKSKFTKLPTLLPLRHILFYPVLDHITCCNRGQFWNSASAITKWESFFVLPSQACDIINCGSNYKVGELLQSTAIQKK